MVMRDVTILVNPKYRQDTNETDLTFELCYGVVE